MKKTRRLLCMSLAVVMLLGAIPAYAATPMTAAASLIALPLSGKLFTALPVSDSISKALTVKEIESTYSTETKSAPTSAPVEQTTFATTANPAPANRLPDGTTGATVGAAGIASGKCSDLFTTNAQIKGPYGGNRKPLDTLKNRKDKTLTSSSCCNMSIPCVLYVDITKCTPADLVGVIIPADMTVDVFTYDPNTRVYTFLCQYDTHGTGAFTIEQAPSAWTGKQPRKAPARAATSFNDVKSGDWYYEAVTALAQGGVLHTAFDTDPNGNFNPNALIKDSEIDFILRRLRGIETEGLVLNASLDKVETKTGYEPTDEFNALTTSSTRDRVLRSILQYHNGLAAKPAAPAQLDTRQADRDAIAKFVEYYAGTKTNRAHWNESVDKCRAIVQEEYAKADALNLIRTPGTPDAIDFDARITRAEYCVLLYRAGLTSFGCNAPKK